MQSLERLVVVLGTGGTIAGTAATAGDNVGYTAAQIGIGQLVAAIPPLAGVPTECEQVAQLDSKDMDHATWQRLAQRAAHHLARENVCGVVVTHGTDTMEETAYFLQRVLAPAKPLVLTGAMRPATSLQADGPQNLLDAVAVADEPGARGVTVVFAGTVHGAFDVRKAHPYRLDAFSSGDAGPIAYVEEGRLRRLRDWPQGAALGLDVIATDPATWPRVEIVTSHAGANGAIVDALVASGVKGLVVAGTGNGKVHRELQAVLDRAQSGSVRVACATRCATGAIVAPSDAGVPPESTALSPAQARIALLLQLLAARS
jgi:L-asparaginase